MPEVIPSCPEIEFVCFLEDTEGLRITDPSWDLPNVRLVHMKQGSAAKRLLWDLPRLAKREQLDLLHTQYVSPPASSVPCLVTLHDVLFESHPELFGPLFRLRSKLLMRHSARRAEHVLTVSEYSRQQIHERYGIEAARLSVVHNGVDGTRFFPGEKDAELVERRGLAPGRYLLSVGRLELRKNYDVLARAHAALGEQAPPLVLVGKRGQGTDQVLEQLKPQVERGLVHLLQDVSDAELPALYRHAQVFCYPSEAEGFGMPPLEAMASGTPVITSNTTALPEVVGDGGLQIDPRDVPALRDAILHLVNNPRQRQAMAASGLQRAKAFDWKNSAAALSQVYRDSLGPGSTMDPLEPADLVVDVDAPRAALPMSRGSLARPEARSD